MFLVCVPCHAARHRRPSRLTRFLSIAFRRPALTPHTHQLERKAPPMCMCRIRIRSLECSTRSLAGGRRCTQTASSIAAPLRRACAVSGIVCMSAAHIGSQARKGAAHIRSQEAIGAPTQPPSHPTNLGRYDLQSWIEKHDPS